MSWEIVNKLTVKEWMDAVEVGKDLWVLSCSETEKITKVKLKQKDCDPKDTKIAWVTLERSRVYTSKAFDKLIFLNEKAAINKAKNIMTSFKSTRTISWEEAYRWYVEFIGDQRGKQLEEYVGDEI